MKVVSEASTNVKPTVMTHISLLILIVLVHALTHFGMIAADSPAYMNLAKFFRGDEGLSEGLFFMHRPLVPFLVSLLYPIVGLREAFGILNTVFWTLATIMIYMLSREFVDETSAFYAAVLTGTSYLLILYGAAIMTDSAGLFFLTLGCYLVLKSLSSPMKSALAGLVTGIGSLAREVVFATDLFALFMSVRKRRIKSLLAFFSTSLIIPFSWQMIIPKGYFYYYFSWTGLVHKMATPSLTLIWQAWGPTIFPLVFFAHRLAGVFSVIGFLLWSDEEKVRSWLLLFLSVFITLFLWPAKTWRLVMMLFPATMIVAGLGILKMSELLSKKPLFNKMNVKSIALILLLTSIVDCNYQALEASGFVLSFPWTLGARVP